MTFEPKKLLDGLCSKVGQFKAEKPSAGTKFRLMGLVEDILEVTAMLLQEVLEVVRREAVLDADPDIIFVIEQGKSDGARKSFTENFSGKPLWQEMTAVKNGHVFDLPKEYFQYKPNAKWDEAYRYVMEILDEE